MNDAGPTAAPKRRHLPPRRPSETRRLHWAGRTIFVTIGYDPASGAPSEIFYNGGYRSGSDMEALVSDLCIALSVMLQHEGVTAATLGKSMGEAFDTLTGEPVPASVLGLLLDELSRPPDRGGVLAWPDTAGEFGSSGEADGDRAEGRAPDAQAGGEAKA